MASKKHPPSEMPPVSKHLWRTPGWMPVQQYREYQKKRVETVRAERNEDSLDKFSRGFQIETASLSHVSGWSWNATPFWQLKIQPRKDVHHVGSLISVNTNASYFD